MSRNPNKKGVLCTPFFTAKSETRSKTETTKPSNHKISSLLAFLAG